MDLMKANIAHGVRPTALILGKDSGKPWNRMDVVFAKAYQRFLNEVCQQCGLPKYLCHTDDNRVQFKPRKDECEATKVAAKAQRDWDREHEKNPVFGVRFVADPYLTDEAIAEGMEFSDFRVPYFMDRARAMGLIPTDQESATPSE